MPEVSIIMVAYRSADSIAPALRSVAAQEGVSWELIVVDNSPDDATASVVRRSAPGAWLIKSPENEGYGRGNNRGFRLSSGELVLLLNPDAELVTPDTLLRLKQAFDRHVAWGLAGLRLLDHDGREQSPPAHSYPGEKRSGCDFSGLPGDIAWVLGAGLGVRRRVYEQLNGFDPGFFLYSEETDFCLRARQLGWSVGHLPDIDVRHIGGASETGSDPGELMQRKMTGMHRFWAKHYGREAALRLAHRDAWRAAWRLAVHGVRAKLGPSGSGAWRKHRHYLGLWRASKRFIANGGAAPTFEQARALVTRGVA